MSRFKEVVRNTWVFGAAVIILAGSSYTMAVMLKQDTHATTVVHSTVTHIQGTSTPSPSPGGYTVIDESKKIPSQPSAFLVFTLTGLTNQEEIAKNKQLIEQRYRKWIANHTPSAIDMSAQQAAAYAATVVKKAYGLDLKGYIAEAEFANLTYINSRQWDVEFYNPEVGKKKVNYQCSVDAVTGSLLDLYAVNPLLNKSSTAIVKDPPWVAPTAKRDISKILPKHVFITSGKVVGHKGDFIYVVCNLSNGSAIGVSLKLSNRFAYWYHVFPNGYDGSWASY